MQVLRRAARGQKRGCAQRLVIGAVSFHRQFDQDLVAILARFFRPEVEILRIRRKGEGDVRGQLVDRLFRQRRVEAKPADDHGDARARAPVVGVVIAAGIIFHRGAAVRRDARHLAERGRAQHGRVRVGNGGDGVERRNGGGGDLRRALTFAVNGDDEVLRRERRFALEKIVFSRINENTLRIGAGGRMGSVPHGVAQGRRREAHFRRTFVFPAIGKRCARIRGVFKLADGQSDAPGAIRVQRRSDKPDDEKRADCACPKPRPGQAAQDRASKSATFRHAFLLVLRSLRRANAGVVGSSGKIRRIGLINRKHRAFVAPGV